MGTRRSAAGKSSGQLDHMPDSWKRDLRFSYLSRIDRTNFTTDGYLMLSLCPSLIFLGHFERRDGERRIYFLINTKEDVGN